jgi:cytidylate kinase
MTEADRTAGKPVIVAIDGPSGVGKSTAAKLLSRRLGVPYLDTGAMYRAVALAALDRGVSPDDEDGVAALAGEIDLALTLDEESGGARVLLDGEPVEERIRTTRVGETTSRISTVAQVRERLVALQQEFARRHGGVIEGRDIGTRVFPDTPHKFFLDARQDERYRRRFEELRAKGSDATYSEVVIEIDRRDQRDSHRAESPLTCDETYTLIDTSDLTPDELVVRMEAAVRESRGG